MRKFLETRTNPVTGKPEAWNELAKEWQSPEKFYGGKAADQKSKLVECYESLGLNGQEAKIAAGIERGIRTKNVNKVFDAALSLGLSEAEAKIFQNPDQARCNSMPFGWTEETLPNLKREE